MTSKRTMASLAAGTALAVTAAAAAAGLVAGSADAAAGCSVAYAVSSSWPGGFGANVTVTNYGDPVNGWRLTWSYTAGQTITQLWNGSYTQSGGQVTVTSASYNGSIPTNGTASFGFNGAWNGSNPAPASFTLNGVTCTGPTTNPPSSPAAPSSAPPSSAPPSSAPPSSAPPSSAPPSSAPPSVSPSTPAAIDTSFPVTREGAYGTNVYTVFRPTSPAAVGHSMPVVVFGNGACAHTNNNEVIGALTFIASHGFVVVDIGSVNNTSNGLSSGSPMPSLLTGGISWAERENARSGAALYQRLDLAKVAVAGHSCGGLEALVAAEDARVKSVVSLDSGFFADGSFGYPRSELSKLHTPALFMDGGPSDIAYDNTRANYNLATVPSVLAEQSQAGHTGFIFGSQMNEGMTVVVQFLDFTLNGTASARSYILGPGGLATRPNWTVQSKNF